MIRDENTSKQIKANQPAEERLRLSVGRQPITPQGEGRPNSAFSSCSQTNAAFWWPGSRAPLVCFVGDCFPNQSELCRSDCQLGVPQATLATDESTERMRGK